jgi:hypothetical protein
LVAKVRFLLQTAPFSLSIPSFGTPHAPSTRLPERRTRLVISGYAAARPRLVQAIASLLFWEPSHWIMQRRQFANLRRRAERASSGDREASSSRLQRTRA